LTEFTDTCCPAEDTLLCAAYKQRNEAGKDVGFLLHPYGITHERDGRGLRRSGPPVAPFRTLYLLPHTGPVSRRPVRPGHPGGLARHVLGYLLNRLGDQFRNVADRLCEEPLDGNGMWAGVHVDVRGPFSGLVPGEHRQRE
jgi:hypothetical protein